jgi:hypothetical protein
MKYADMKRLNGARVVIIQDVRSWKAKEMPGGGGKLLYESAEDGGCGVWGNKLSRRKKYRRENGRTVIFLLVLKVLVLRQPRRCWRKTVTLGTRLLLLTKKLD